jgi:hypothetical protein
MTAITPEGLREKARKLEVQWIASGEALYVPAHEHIESLNAHAAVLEELARLKAPVEVAGMADNLRQGATVLDEPFHHGAIGDEMCAAAAALESLAAKLAICEKDRQRLIDSNEHWHIRVQQLLSDKQNAQDAQESAEQQLAERDAALSIAGQSLAECGTKITALQCSLAERDAAYAALKGHAEVMWKSHFISPPHDYLGAFDAYRAAYPKE